MACEMTPLMVGGDPTVGDVSTIDRLLLMATVVSDCGSYQWRSVGRERR